MADRDDAIIKLHEDVPLFREAIAFTAAKTGFNGQVIENYSGISPAMAGPI